MKSTRTWRKKRSPRLTAIEYTSKEGGIWQPFPFEKIKAGNFNDRVERTQDNVAIFNYAGTELIFHSVRFADPFMRKSTDLDRNVWDATVWKLTGFATPWRDEYQSWEKA